MTRRMMVCASALAAVTAFTVPAVGDNGQGNGNGNGNDSSCAGLPSYNQLRAAMVAAAAPGNPNIVGPNRGFGLDMWGTVVNRDGVVCAVVFTGNRRGDQWPGS